MDKEHRWHCLLNAKKTKKHEQTKKLTKENKQAGETIIKYKFNWHFIHADNAFDKGENIVCWLHCVNKFKCSAFWYH